MKSNLAKISPCNYFYNVKEVISKAMLFLISMYQVSHISSFSVETYVLCFKVKYGEIKIFFVEINMTFGLSTQRQECDLALTICWFVCFGF